MIYQDKTDALDDTPLASGPCLVPRRTGVTEFNHRVARTKAPASLRQDRLLEKVKAFKSAAQLRAAGLYPYFRVISSAQDTEVLIDGKKVLMLGSNSYLGLTNHPKIKEAARAAGGRWPGWRPERRIRPCS